MRLAPKNPFARFAWALVQLPRAFWWQISDGELRRLLLLPTILTVVIGIALIIGAAVLSGTIIAWTHSQEGAHVAAVAVTFEYLLLFAVLSLAAIFLTWHAQSAFAAPAFERMTLHVQRKLDGDAPEPNIGALEVMRRALRALFPRVRSLILWALTAAAGATLVFVPVIGAPLAIGVQALIAALFLAHGTITDNRTRLGLPRRFLLKEPALMLGLSVGLVPLVLVPPILLFSGGPIAIGGAFVALGARAEKSEAEDLPDGTARNQP